MKKNYYDIFGLEKNAPIDDIKRAYRKLAFKYHPDKNSGDSKFENIFKQINAMYEILSNDELRKKYDDELRRQSESIKYSNPDGRANQQKNRPPAKENTNFSSFENQKISNAILKSWSFLKNIYIYIVLILALFIVLHIISNDKAQNNYINTNSSEEITPATGEITFGKPNEETSLNEKSKDNSSINIQNASQQKKSIEHSEKTGEIKF
jgi:curved DNA-binding protein CbpA